MTRFTRRARFTRLNQVTRADLLKLFSLPGATRAETRELVRRYIGDAPVPPAWSRAGVEGTFGRVIASRWARHVQHRPSGYVSGANARGSQWVVQTMHDIVAASRNAKSPAAGGTPPALASRRTIVPDEFWLAAGAMRPKQTLNSARNDLLAGRQ
jgi:hypothetical protein